MVRTERMEGSRCPRAAGNRSEREGGCRSKRPGGGDRARVGRGRGRCRETGPKEQRGESVDRGGRTEGERSRDLEERTWSRKIQWKTGERSVSADTETSRKTIEVNLEI